MFFGFNTVGIAQETTTLQSDSVGGSLYVNFIIERGQIQSDYKSNQAALEQMCATLNRLLSDSTVTVQRVVISGFGSPDGPYAVNARLAEQRAISLRDYMEGCATIAPGQVEISVTPEDWAGLLTLVERTSAEELPQRQQLLQLLRDNSLSDIDKELALRQQYPEAFGYLADYVMPQLRRSEYWIHYQKSIPVLMPATAAESMPTQMVMTKVEPVVTDTAMTGMQTVKETRTILWPRTNLLLPLLNVGLEFPIGNRWSVGADWYYPWAFRSSSHKNCYQVDGLSIEGRYWLGSKHRSGAENKRYRLLGHSIGLFVMGGRYDWEHNYRGYQGEYILGGVDYLYAKPIFKGRMHLEFALGIGYFYSKATHYEVFERGGLGYRDKDYRKIFQYFGPLKANVSLVVPIRITKTKVIDR